MAARAYVGRREPRYGENLARYYEECRDRDWCLTHTLVESADRSLERPRRAIRSVRRAAAGARNRCGPRGARRQDALDADAVRQRAFRRSVLSATARRRALCTQFCVADGCARSEIHLPRNVRRRPQHLRPAAQFAATTKRTRSRFSTTCCAVGACLHQRDIEIFKQRPDTHARICAPASDNSRDGEATFSCGSRDAYRGGHRTQRLTSRAGADRRAGRECGADQRPGARGHARGDVGPTRGLPHRSLAATLWVLMPQVQLRAADGYPPAQRQRLIMTPTEGDFANPEIAALSRKYLRGKESLGARSRAAIQARVGHDWRTLW